MPETNGQHFQLKTIQPPCLRDQKSFSVVIILIKGIDSVEASKIHISPNCFCVLLIQFSLWKVQLGQLGSYNSESTD